MFFTPDRGVTVMISTADNYLQGPSLGLQSCRYPIQPTNHKYTIAECQHNMKHIGFEQIRRNDEAPNILLQCDLCGFTIIK
jgi:DNA-directed RNA polymerase subunit M/transcription elongation factor TFIIS